MKPEAAQMIESLLKSEGVNCYLRKRIYEPDPIPGQCGRHPHRTAWKRSSPCKGDSGSKRIRIFRKKTKRTSSSKPFSGWVRHVPFLRHPGPSQKQIIVRFYPCSRIPGLGHLLRLACFIQLNNCKLWHAERLQIVKPYVSLILWGILCYMMPCIQRKDNLRHRFLPWLRQLSLCSSLSIRAEGEETSDI